MNSSESLYLIPTESILLLRNLYKVNWPEHVAVYNFLTKLIDRFRNKLNRSEIIKIYSISGGVNEDGTFVAIMQDEDIFIGTMNPSSKNLIKCLSQLKYDSNKMFFYCVRDIYKDTVLNFMKNHDLSINPENNEFGTAMMYLKHQDAIELKFEIPKGLVTRSLSTSEADKINSVWPHRFPGSEKYIARCIASGISVGLYSKETGELLAWCLEDDLSCLSALQVDENHLRKGYATLVTKVIAKKIAQERGFDVITNIVRTNVKSLALFEKLNFKKIDTNHWIGVIKN